MMKASKYLLTFSFIFCCESILLINDSPRKVIQILQVDNGGDWGDWNPPQYCAEGHYAIGYNMKMEAPQGSSDDTELNSILLKCESAVGQYGRYKPSGEGAWGGWVGETLCNKAGSQMFLTSFTLQVETNQGRSDDTAANFVKFTCRDSAICGIQTKVESPQGSDDDCALNDVKFFCCKE
ncbi:vitelline membrane outer layer protein 1-like [Mytilus galloprovincialis]|uniref:vitelline membrane outer layer protein 1-like n=1 Tax=Mytilus galloprovincialis TaxID=29158 RepID=UPI003F7C70E1